MNTMGARLYKDSPEHSGADIAADDEVLLYDDGDRAVDDGDHLAVGVACEVSRHVCLVVTAQLTEVAPVVACKLSARGR